MARLTPSGRPSQRHRDRRPFDGERGEDGDGFLPLDDDLDRDAPPLDAFVGGDAALEAPPLRFDAPASRAAALGVAADSYASPRPSRWRALRPAMLVTLGVVALLVVTWAAWSPTLDALAEGAGTLASREGDGRTQESVSVGLVAIAVLAFVVAWWRHSHPRRPVRLSDGRGTMSVDAIAGQLRAAILDLPEVRSAEVMVENRGGGQVRVRTRLRVTAETRIDDALDGVDDAAEWLVHHQLGLMLAEPPLAEVRYDELDLRAARAGAGVSAADRAAGRPDGELDD